MACNYCLHRRRSEDSTHNDTDAKTMAVMVESCSVVCRRCLPFLKFVRGTGWERKHWTQLFGMLKLVTKVGPVVMEASAQPLQCSVNVSACMPCNHKSYAHLP